MTMKLATKSGYLIKPTDISIWGVNRIWILIGETAATVRLRLNSFEVKLKFLVMQNVAETFPSVYYEESIMKMVKRIEYADSGVVSPRKINMIIGNLVFFQLLRIRQVRLVGTGAIWQKVHWKSRGAPSVVLVTSRCGFTMIVSRQK